MKNLFQQNMPSMKAAHVCLFCVPYLSLYMLSGLRFWHQSSYAAK